MEQVQRSKPRNIAFNCPWRLYSTSGDKRTNIRCHTPVDVRRSDTLAWWCLNFLIERHAALIKWGFEPANMLFASPIGKNKVFAQLHTPLKEIQERHNLPPFSLEQLRTEKINRNILERGRKSAMHAAGHGSPNQTDDYAEQQMNKQLNSAISLEFTNRLAIQIKENIKNGTTTWTAINRAKSIGDGSQCSNPTLPPLDAWLEGEQCNAEHCHQEGGCSNRVITIDTARLEELALTKRFYTRNWRRMFDENNERFEKSTSRTCFLQPFSKELFLIALTPRFIEKLNN